MKRFTWAFAMLPILAMGLFYLNAPRSTQKASTSRSQKDSQKPKSASMLKFEAGMQEFNGEMKQAKERSIQSGKEFADRMTPEVIKRRVYLRLRHRDAYYTGLFASWGLDAKTA